MAEVKPAVETFAKIKVVGVGGGGNAAINRMIQSKIRGVDFIAINTDVQALHKSHAPVKLHIGKSVTKGLGAGMNPAMGRSAAEESANEIREALKEADMVFVTCGLGGGTGTGAAPVVAEIARELGALTIAVVTKPFSWEGARRMQVAEEGHAELREHLDTIITIPNDRVHGMIEKKTPMRDAFNIVDDILRQGVQGISEAITVPGDVNVDFADVKTIMQGQGSALMGIGRASGETRAIDAAKAAIESPLLDVSIEGARGILYIVTGNESLGMHEVSEAAQVITESAAQDATVIFGAVIDESMGDDVKVTVVATGFDGENASPVTSSLRDVLSAGSLSVKEVKKVVKPAVMEDAVEKEESTQEFFVKPRRVKSIDTQLGLQEPSQKEELVTENEDLNTPAFQRNPKEREPEAEVQDELDIPAFIRKKMN